MIKIIVRIFFFVVFFCALSVIGIKAEEEIVTKKQREVFSVKKIDYYGVIVEKVISGNTLQLADGEIVRLIGIDTPEVQQDSKMYTDAKLTGIQVEILEVMGNEAAQFTRQLVEGKEVRIEFDEQKFDCSNLLLGYVYILGEQEIFVNAEIIKKGYARLDILTENVKYKDLFEKLQSEARQNTRGIWAKWQR